MLLYTNQVCYPKFPRVRKKDVLEVNHCKRKCFQHVGKEVNLSTATWTAIHKCIFEGYYLSNMLDKGSKDSVFSVKGWVCGSLLMKSFQHIGKVVNFSTLLYTNLVCYWKAKCVSKHLLLHPSSLAKVQQRFSLCHQSHFAWYQF